MLKLGSDKNLQLIKLYSKLDFIVQFGFDNITVYPEGVPREKVRAGNPAKDSSNVMAVK